MDKYKQFENSLFELISKEFSKFNKDSVLILQKAAKPYYAYVNSFRNYLNIKNLKFDKSILLSFEFHILYRTEHLDFELLKEMFSTIQNIHDLVQNDDVSKETVYTVLENYRIADSSNYYNRINIATIFDTAGFHSKAEKEFSCAENILEHIRNYHYKFYLLEKNYPDQDILLDDVFNISKNDKDIILKTFIKSEKKENYFHLISSGKSLKEICDSYSVNSFDVLSSSTLYYSMLNDNIEFADTEEKNLVTGSALNIENAMDNKPAEISKKDLNILHKQIKELNTVKHKLNNFSIDSASTDVSDSLLSITETLENLLYKAEMLPFDELFNNLKKFLPDLEQEYEIRLRLMTISSGRNLYKSEEREIIFRILRFIRLIISFQKDYRSYQFSELKVRIEVVPTPEYNEIKLMAFDFYDKEDMENQEFQQQSLSQLHHFVKDISDAAVTSFLYRHNCLLLSSKCKNPDVLQSYVIFEAQSSLFCLEDIFINKVSSAHLEELLKYDNNSRLALDSDNTNLPLYFTEEVINMKEFSHEEIPLSDIAGKKILHIQVHGNEIGIICDSITNSGKFTALEVPELLTDSLPVVSGFIEYKDSKLLPILKIDKFISQCSTAVIIDLIDSNGFEKETSDKKTIMTFDDSGLKLGLDKEFVSGIIDASGNMRKIGKGIFFSDGENTYPVISLNSTADMESSVPETGYVICIDRLVHTFGIYASDIHNFASNYVIVNMEKILTNFTENYIKINDSKYAVLLIQNIHDSLFSDLKIEYKNDFSAGKMITN